VSEELKLLLARMAMGFFDIRVAEPRTDDDNFIRMRATDGEFYSVSEINPEIPIGLALVIIASDFDHAKKITPQPIKRKGQA
jgi:hypothetical protein